jgi:hypothetical protein
LGLAEVEPPGERQEPGGPTRVVQQCPAHHPVVGADGGRPVGQGGGILSHVLNRTFSL